MPAVLKQSTYKVIIRKRAVQMAPLFPTSAAAASGHQAPLLVPGIRTPFFLIQFLGL